VEQKKIKDHFAGNKKVENPRERPVLNCLIMLDTKKVAIAQDAEAMHLPLSMWSCKV
jgi:hypothetical protein